MRLIDADALINQMLSEAEADTDTSKETRLAKLITITFCKIIKNEPTIQPKFNWIPVTERLPETEDFVLASLTGKYRNIHFEHAIQIASCIDGEWWVQEFPEMSEKKCRKLIEAWMPLPEMYGGGE